MAGFARPGAAYGGGVSDSSPADLAVAFRSFPRRLRQALAALDDDGARRAAAPHDDAARRGIAEAARLIGAPAGADAEATAAAVADRIEAVHPDRWDDAVLDGLRRQALAVGAAVRAITDLAG